MQFFIKFYLVAIVSDESVNESNLIDKNVKKTLSRKRKTPGKRVYFLVCMFFLFNHKIEDDESPFMADTTKKLTSSILSTNEGLLCR
jgi:hypothetical protein